MQNYDHYIVCFSGGKDSMATALWLLEQGIPASRIELWHHLIDGREGSTLMDWPVTGDYCRKFAKAFGFPIYFSWKQGGFEAEMLRENARTRPIRFETPDPNSPENIIECGAGGVRGKFGTRLQFPQVSADLRVRWCSAYLKIDVCTAAINNQPRFHNSRTLVLTGERAEESPARSRYKEFEPHRSDRRDGRLRKHVDHIRPVHSWIEEKVWEIIERHRVVPHPAYRLGWGRLSCISCIFGSPNQWASVNKIDGGRVKIISDYEEMFGKTIHRKLSVYEQISKGVPYPGMNARLIESGLSREYSLPVLTDSWELPNGAFGENAGPI